MRRLGEKAMRRIPKDALDAECNAARPAAHAAREINKQRMRAVNSLVGQIDAVSTAYGINSTLLEIDLKISVEMLVISPFLLDPQQIEVKIPLVMQIVQGQIPQLMVGQIA